LAAKAVAHDTNTVAIQPQYDAPPPKSRRFRFTRPDSLVIILLLAANGIIGLAGRRDDNAASEKSQPVESKGGTEI
jgi:hypothetical protein